LVADRKTREWMAPTVSEDVADELRCVYGIMVRGQGSTLILAPPLVLNEQQARRAAGAIVDVLSRLDGRGRLAPR
jgi:adenosylmethionine-8-amino-7-oxononanoate aminotransferase